MGFWLSLFNINITYQNKNFKEKSPDSQLLVIRRSCPVSQEEYFFYLLEKYAKPSSVLILIQHILRM